MKRQNQVMSTTHSGLQVHYFTFNPFQENTYVIWDETGECILVDPGCYDAEEKQELEHFITAKNLTPVKLINTHAHIDHVLGNSFVAAKWNLLPELHATDLALLKSAPVYGEMWGIRPEPSPDPEIFLNEGDQVKFGNTTLDVLFVPGHCPGHIALYSRKHKVIFSGDVLFQNSIGRTDLPGGDYDELIQSIVNKLMVLENDVVVYSGHGPSTTIGDERRNNPFLYGKL